MDWSYAGYAAGDKRIPKFAIAADIKSDFGAVGDGKTDDTQAFLAAVESVRDRATIYIPEGKCSKLCVAVWGVGRKFTSTCWLLMCTSLCGPGDSCHGSAFKII